MANDEDALHKPTKNRSPAYPAIGLEACVGGAQKIYNKERKSPVSALIAVQHIGYSSLSGPSRVALSAMKKFGLLLEEGGNRVRVSDEAVKVFLSDGDQRLAILRSLAVRPDIIREILSSHPDGLPSDQNLKFNLVTDRGFGEDAANALIKSLHETIRFAQLDPASYPEQAMQSTEQPEIGPHLDISKAVVWPKKDAATPQQPAPSAVGSPAPMRFELSDGTSVEIRTSKAPSPDTIEELRDYLTVYEKILKKRAAAPAGSDPSDPGATS